jgi:predicted dehydrogenase
VNSAISSTDIELSIPSLPDSDPRWSLQLAGGATMDLGCYVLNAARQFGRWHGQAPSVVSAEATLKKSDVDAAMWVELACPGGIRGRLHWNMNADRRRMVWTVTGTAGTAVVPGSLSRTWTTGSSSRERAVTSRLTKTRYPSHGAYGVHPLTPSDR